MFSSSASPPGEGVLGPGEGRYGPYVLRVCGGLGRGGAAAVVPVESGGDDRGEDVLGPGRVPVQGRLGGGARVQGPDEFAGEVPHQVVGHVPAVRRLLQERHVDEPVEGGLGVPFVGAGEPGQQGCAVDGQVERADVAQGERRVPVGTAG